MQCEGTGQSPKGRCSSLVLLISLAQHWLCLVVSHRATLCLCPKIPSAPALRQCRTRIWAPSLGCHYMFELIVLTLRTPFEQQHGGNSTSNQKSDTRATRTHTLAQRGTTKALYPACPCSSSWSAEQTPEPPQHTASFAHMVMDFTHWDSDWWAHLLSSWQAKVWPTAPSCSSQLTALTFRQCGQVQHTKQPDCYTSKNLALIRSGPMGALSVTWTL